MVERLLGSEASTALRGCPTRLLLPGAARAADGSVLAYSPPTVPGVERSELCLEGRPWARPATALGGVAAFELGAVGQAMLIGIAKWVIGIALAVLALYLTFRNSTDICAERATTQQEYEDCVDHYSDNDPNT